VEDPAITDGNSSNERTFRNDRDGASASLVNTADMTAGYFLG
jgi:hypothetical protein